MFVPVHVKSAYSLGTGTATVERLVERASALALPAMALTDIDNLYGAIVFYRLARARGIRPILGVEIPLDRRPRAAPGGEPASGEARHGPGGPGGPGGPAPLRAAGERLVILARDRTGYENLCRI